MSNRVYVPLIVGLLLTIAVGWQHHRMVGVKSPKLMAVAADQLGGIPKSFGKWRTIRENQLSEEVIKMLQCSAHVSRIYEHEETKQTISIVVLLGPHGPMAVHIPEICYSNSGFQSDSEAKRCRIPQAGGTATDQFWQVSMRSLGEDGLVQRVYYGWSEGGSWTRPKYPRMAFGRAPYLYKLQMATTEPGESSRGSDGRETAVKLDPPERFLEEFLEAARPYIMGPEAAQKKASA